jgi:hypothetical protein
MLRRHALYSCHPIVIEVGHADYMHGPSTWSKHTLYHYTIYHLSMYMPCFFFIFLVLIVGRVPRARAAPEAI